MLKGQWTGPYACTDSGEIIAELDQDGSNLVGTVAAYSSNPQLPPAIVPVTIPDGVSSLDQTFSVFPLDANYQSTQWSVIANNFPAGTTMSTTVETKFRLSASGPLYVGWVSNLGYTGLAVLTQAPLVSKRKALPINNWDEFKEYALQQPPYRYIFRGQSDNRWPLRTHFHRTGRADLRRFVNVDVPAVHRSLSGLTSHYFQLNDSAQYGAFNALAQHHGYPTPLLDWTFSPYVAAFFAFRTVKKSERDSDERVRILIFDAQEWMKDWPQITLYIHRRHFSLFGPIGINNPRMVPQQALPSISNVDDIEGYLAERENDRQKTYLTVIDLPKSERSKVMQELAIMGITAGSLFPGLDGACEQLRERYFDY